MFPTSLGLGPTIPPAVCVTNGIADTIVPIKNAASRGILVSVAGRYDEGGNERVKLIGKVPLVKAAGLTF